MEWYSKEHDLVNANLIVTDHFDVSVPSLAARHEAWKAATASNVCGGNASTRRMYVAPAMRGGALQHAKRIANDWNKPDGIVARTRSNEKEKAMAGCRGKTR